MLVPKVKPKVSSAIPAWRHAGVEIRPSRSHVAPHRSGNQSLPVPWSATGAADTLSCPAWCCRDETGPVQLPMMPIRIERNPILSGPAKGHAYRISSGGPFRSHVAPRRGRNRTFAVLHGAMHAGMEFNPFRFPLAPHRSGNPLPSCVAPGAETRPFRSCVAPWKSIISGLSWPPTQERKLVPIPQGPTQGQKPELSGCTWCQTGAEI